MRTGRLELYAPDSFSKPEGMEVLTDYLNALGEDRVVFEEVKKLIGLDSNRTKRLCQILSNQGMMVRSCTYTGHSHYYMKRKLTLKEVEEASRYKG